jgi:formate hydrogenlyase subunit 5
MTVVACVHEHVAPERLAKAVAAAVRSGDRFAGLVASADRDGTTRLRALLGRGTALGVVGSALGPGRDAYPALTPLVPAAHWYERAIHDLFGVVPAGHPRLDPLVFPLVGEGRDRPRPGTPHGPGRLEPDPSSLGGHVRGEGVFTIPYGPVRSGVFEAVEYLVETFGEDIAHVRVRPYLKHRGLLRRFAGLSVADAAVLAERVEGTMSVAHAWAFAEAVEGLAGVEPPPAAQAQRVLHAELERVANHLDSMLRLTEGAAQAVAHARLGWHKERVLRLQAALCGHRFCRGLVRPGGTAGPPLLGAAETRAALRDLGSELRADLDALMRTASFLDRLQGTGVVPPELARSHGALGPVGRGSGAGPDVRAVEPYGGYRAIPVEPAPARHDGDALARQQVRGDEVAESLRLADVALAVLERRPDGPFLASVGPVEGTALGRVESPQGELVYLVELSGDHVEAACVRTASFHNFALFPSAFRGDVLTDFVFIEGSFAVSLAGVAG